MTDQDGIELHLPPRMKPLRGPAGTGPDDIKELTAAYHRFIKGLTCIPCDLLWWAGPLASKNPFDSPLFEALVKFTSVLDRADGRMKAGIPARVVADDPLIGEDLEAFCRRSGIPYSGGRRRMPFGLHILFRSVLFTGFFLVLHLYRKLVLWLVLRKHIARALGDPRPAYLVRSWIDHRSFDAAGQYRDAYFGNLPSLLGAGRRVVVVAEIVWTYPYLSAARLIRSQYPGLTIIPQEHFLALSDLVRAALLPFAGIPELREGITFSGRDVRGIVERAIRIDRSSLTIRNNLAIHYLTREMGRQIPLTHFTYSFENHAHEKMMLLGLREQSRPPFSIGYQHGGLSRMLLNYFLAEGEAACVPLPDRILTTGEETRRILVEEGHFPADRVHPSCALRYGYLDAIGIRKRGNARVLFAPLPVDIEAARAVLALLDATFRDLPGYEIRVKNHPLIPWEDIVGGAGPGGLAASIVHARKDSTADLLAKSDMVLYTQTTTCIEALRVGVPVVFLDVFTLFDADYILLENPFRWTASDPVSLRKAVEEISRMDEASFLARQREGVRYGMEYLTPVSDTALACFVP